jgi:hypothetical protein
MAKNEKIPKTNASEVEALIERFKGSQLKPGDAELIERLLRTVVMLLDLLERKNLSIKKLKAMIFSPRTERRQTIGRVDEEKSEEKSESPPSRTEQKSGRSTERSESEEIGEKTRREGHGRRASSDYSGAKAVSCRHEKLKAGDRCPGLLCLGRPLIEVTKYEREVLRCAVCLEQYVAPLPEGVRD